MYKKKKQKIFPKKQGLTRGNTFVWKDLEVGADLVAAVGVEEALHPRLPEVAQPEPLPRGSVDLREGGGA